MPVSGEIRYEGFKVFLTGAQLELNLLPVEGLGGLGALLGLGVARRTTNFGLIVDTEVQERGEEFYRLLSENAEAFRKFIVDNISRRQAFLGVLVFEGGATKTSLGRVEFQGEFRRPTMEDYEALDKFVKIADQKAEEAMLEHCKTCAECASAEGLPIPEGVTLNHETSNVIYPWGYHPGKDDDQVH